MQQYKNLLRDILTNGRRRGDRTGTGTLSVFGRQLTFDLQDGFPLVTLKRTPMRPIVAELVWFLEGSGVNKRLRQLTGLTEGQRGIWDQWAVTKDHLALTREQRMGLWNTAHARKEGTDIDTKAKAVAFEKTQAGEVVTLDSVIDEILDTAGIFTHKPSCNGLRVDSEKVDRLVNEEVGRLGPIYGVQWRQWDVLEDDGNSVHFAASYDQIKILIKGLKNNPYSRRHIVSAWNVADLPDESKSPQQNVLDGKMALAPCHAFFQCYVRDMTLEERLDYYNTHMASIGMRLGMDANTDHAATHELLDKLGVRSRYLDLHMYQRSWDVPVGAPFNIASYALLTHLLARECGYLPGELIISAGDAHIYANQMAEVDVMMMRDIRPMPKFHLDAWVSLTDIMDSSIEDKSEIIQRLVDGLEGYDPHPAIKIAVAT